MASDSGGSDGGPGIRSVLSNGVRVLSLILQALTKSFPQQTGTSGTATGGAATLPGNPVGFVVITLPDGTSAKLPYYS